MTGQLDSQKAVVCRCFGRGRGWQITAASLALRIQRTSGAALPGKQASNHRHGRVPLPETRITQSGSGVLVVALLPDSLREAAEGRADGATHR